MNTMNTTVNPSALSALNITFAVNEMTKEAGEENVYGVLAALDLLGIIKVDLLPLAASPAGRVKKQIQKMAGSEPIREQLQKQKSSVDVKSECIASLTLPSWVEELEEHGVDRELLEQLWFTEGEKGERYRLRIRRNHLVFKFLVNKKLIRKPSAFLRKTVTQGWTLSRKYDPEYKSKYYRRQNEAIIREVEEKRSAMSQAREIGDQSREKVSEMISEASELIRNGNFKELAARFSRGASSGVNSGT